MTDPCGWSITKCGCGSCWSSYIPEVQATASALAIGIMWAATARRYGQCTIIVQPCVRPTPMRDYQTYEVTAPYGGAYIQNGVWHNSCSGTGDDASCCSGCEIELDGPTSTSGITDVSINGVSLPAASYIVMNGYILVRTDGECWPTCTNYSNQSPPAFQVEYLRGLPIPASVQSATERLACEFALACTGKNCALPRRLRSMTRQGVEVQVEEFSSKPGEIKTGIPEVDLVIALENPHGRSQPSICLTPDMPMPRVIT